MALESSGTQTATVGTEHTLATLTTEKTYQLQVLTNNMAAGDTLELRIKTKVLGSEASSSVVWMQSYSGAQPSDDLVKVSFPLRSHSEWVATLKQTAGTGRAYNWKVLSL